MLQFGGAAGTLAALGERGLEVAERLAALLDLPLPDAPWHSHRDRLAEVAAAFAILAGTCGKIARDVSLLMQTDVAEAFEPAAPGRGGSSTMPHKRNPTAAAAALAAATIAPESRGHHPRRRGAGARARGSAAGRREWPTFPALALVTSGALAADRRHRPGPRDRRRAHARQSRRDARPDHGRSGDVRARRQARQGARPTRIVEEASRKAAAEQAPSCRTSWPRTSG